MPAVEKVNIGAFSFFLFSFSFFCFSPFFFFPTWKGQGYREIPPAKNFSQEALFQRNQKKTPNVFLRINVSFLWRIFGRHYALSILCLINEFLNILLIFLESMRVICKGHASRSFQRPYAPLFKTHNLF